MLLTQTELLFRICLVKRNRRNSAAQPTCSLGSLCRPRWGPPYGDADAVQFAPTPNKVVVHYKSANLLNALLTTNQASSRMVVSTKVIGAATRIGDRLRW
jgi:hypothetical protein